MAGFREPGSRAPLGDCDALILCGGLGTRLRPAVGDRPKSLAEVGGRPFLDVLLAWLSAQGVMRFLLCAGFGADAVRAALPRWRRFGEIRVSVEPAPLGTGGAVRHALPALRSESVLVANGDSICRVDVAAMLAAHQYWAPRVTLAGAPPERGRGDVGLIRADDDGRVLAFAEKDPAARGFVNAGVYWLDRAWIATWPDDRPLSLERELLPALRPDHARLFPHAGEVLDIGTPERWRGAADWLRERAL